MATSAALLALLGLVSGAAAQASTLPCPFSRSMPCPATAARHIGSALAGNDVAIAQALLLRSPAVSHTHPHWDSGTWGASSCEALSKFCAFNKVRCEGGLDAATAALLLRLHADADGYHDDGATTPGALYKVCLSMIPHCAYFYLPVVVCSHVRTVSRYTSRSTRTAPSRPRRRSSTPT
jgi:hypothetical protein